MAQIGRLTLDKMGYSMPVDAPAYQAPPFHYRNAQAISIKFETDLDAALDALPAPLELIEPATANLSFYWYPFTTFGPYHEAILRLYAQYEGKRLTYIHQIFVDTEPPMLAGASCDHVLSAVDENHLPLNHLGFRARQKLDQAGVVVVSDVAAARIAGGLLPQERVLARSKQVANRLRIQRARRDAIDANAARGEFRRQIANRLHVVGAVRIFVQSREERRVVVFHLLAAMGDVAPPADPLHVVGQR